jgi:hypothetical protein
MNLWLTYVLGLASGLALAWLSVWIGDNRERRARTLRRLAADMPVTVLYGFSQSVGDTRDTEARQ